MRFTDIPIPAMMAHLPKDKRGYPVPVMVLKDKDGRPHFQINEETERQRVIKHGLCAICGRKLLHGKWFVGGPLSAFSQRGLYIDPPLHEECMEYALKVCPYLAAPSYGKRINTKTLKGQPDEEERIYVDPTMMAHRPRFFVAVKATKMEEFPWAGRLAQPGMPPHYIRYIRHPEGSVKAVQVWKDGALATSDDDLRAFVTDLIADLHRHGEEGRLDLWQALSAGIKNRAIA